MTESTKEPPAEAAPSPSGANALAMPAVQGAAVVAARLLAEVGRRRIALADATDPEALHDFRVALRRLRSWIRAFRPELHNVVPRKAIRRLRAIAHDSNDSRDAEVQLQWLADQSGTLTSEARAGRDWLAEQLTGRKQKSDERLRKVLAKNFDRAHAALESSLTAAAERRKNGDTGDGSDTLSAALAGVIRTQTERVRLHLTSLGGPNDDAQAHRARIAGKRLRYVLEPISEALPGAGQLVSRLKLFQDALGEMHDARVLIDAVADAIESAAATHAQRLVAAVRTVGGANDRLVDRTNADLERGLLGVADVLHERAARAFDAVRDAWLGSRGEALLAEALTIAQALDALHPEQTTNTEIERKYLLRELPARAREVTPVEIEQGYVPGDRLVERLRHVRDNGSERWLRTVKFGHGLSRTELEEDMPAGLFDVMWPLTKGRRLRKRRYAIVDGPLTWEIDEFLDRSLFLAEVELPSADTQVSPPEWLAPSIVREVTEDGEFTNEHLAR